MLKKHGKFLKILITVVILLVVSLSNYTISLKQDGFFPSHISVLKGTSIAWVNRDDQSHWPASDNHPTHTQYPSKEKGCFGSALDACKGLRKGESYSFTFDKVGTWGIHDHLFHSHTMTVKVYNNYLDLLKGKLSELFNHRSSSKDVYTLSDVIEKCLQNQDRTKQILCYKENLRGLIQSEGISQLMKKLEEDFKKNDSAGSGGITRCHDIAHAIGQAGISITKDPKTVLTQCSDLCTSGCYHGAVEQYVQHTSSDTFLANLNNLCSSEACFHGLGHGLASIAQFDLQKSLQFCDRLDSENAKRNCGFGVFMELYEPSSFNPIPLSIPENLLAFCSDLSGVYLNVCYRNIGNYELVRTRDIKKAFNICDKIPKDYGRDCRLALGQATYFNSQGKAEYIISTCKNVLGDQFKDCIDGSLMSGVSSDPLARHGFEICSQVDDSIKTHCYQFLGSHIESVYGQEVRQKLCQGTCDNI